MKTLLTTNGERCFVVDPENKIFRIDNAFYDYDGMAVEPKAAFYDVEDEDFDISYERFFFGEDGIGASLTPESTIEPIYEVDDMFGNFGFKDENGEWSIKPQYAFAHPFTKGLAAVNLDRTWYKTENGREFYENHCGYIDKNGQTVIGFNFDEAEPFNKYGLAAVRTILDGWCFIDINGKIIESTQFAHIDYYGYFDRYIGFTRDYHIDNNLTGIYDTKERKIILEPTCSYFNEINENVIKICADGSCSYINAKGEKINPWQQNQVVLTYDIPDKNGVAPVYQVNEDDNYKYCHKKGLSSSDGKLLFPLEYDKIVMLFDDTWALFKGDAITIIRTEPND